MLEIGCGTGALLRALSPRIVHGVGLDVSEAMLAQARERAGSFGNLAFQHVEGSRLPVASHSFELVISFLSFRYLDWRAIWPELLRALHPGGRILVVDLVSARATPRDAPKVVRAALRNLTMPLRHPSFTRALRELTAQPAWQEMLERHPIRPFAEYETFFAEQLPGRRFASLDVTPTRRVVALDSGPLP